MEVEYMTTVDDYVAFCSHFQQRSKIIRLLWIVGWIAGPIVFAIVGLRFAIQDGFSVDGSTYIGALTGFAIALCVLLYPWVYWWLNRELMRRWVGGLQTRGTIGRIKLILNEELFVEITETTRSEVKWRDMDRVDEVGDYTFIMVTGMSAAILPRHGFASDDDYLRVRDFAKAHVGQRK